MSELKYQYGRLSYRKKSTGTEFGREDWWLTRNRDGSTTLRCLSIAGDSKVVRDVFYTRGPDGRPTDAFIRLQVGDQLIGSGYFRVLGTEMEVITDGIETGRSVQTVKVPADFFSITTHSVMIDGWTYFNYDRAKGGEQLRAFYNTSTRWNGTDGPLGRLETYLVKISGDEEITVPAGTFKATRLSLDSDLHKIPASKMWVAGEDKILLRCDWGESDLEYVLILWKMEQ